MIWLSFSLTLAGIRFMGGDPMNVAAKEDLGCSYISPGVPACTSDPSFRRAILSPRVMASVWSWVIYNVVIFNSRCRRFSSARVPVRSWVSRLERGSSSRNTSGRRTRALATETLCRWPPESSAGFRSSRFSMLSISAAFFTAPTAKIPDREEASHDYTAKSPEI